MRQTASCRGTLAATPPETGAAPGVYRRHRPDATALYEVVRDNLETLFGAINDGALAVRLPRHARKELLAYGCALASVLSIFDLSLIFVVHSHSATVLFGSKAFSRRRTKTLSELRPRP